ncbi:hypothetical protein AVEN_168836-1 [Araneus ventricosus]|uniref:HTH psq-type domain-containing protein n=1 Tax=Araneus ventricosus TaxID=182803 RepID=A0A4Y2TXZ9_ARAVE|nr:hypothetical protein AVEN_168836-1 [Araneus ventricosus]
MLTSYLFLPPIPLLSEIHSMGGTPRGGIPFVSKTICLPIKPFSDRSGHGYGGKRRRSVLPFCWLLFVRLRSVGFTKYRTFIYAMKPTERKCVSLTVEQKFQIVSRIEVGETLTKLSKEFGVGVSTVADRRRDSEKIKKIYVMSNCKLAKLRNTMKCANDEEPENVLYKWFI